MKKVDKDLIKKAANSLMFDMKDDEYDSILKEFDVVLKQMELINSVKDIKDYEPMNFPFDIPERKSSKEYEFSIVKKEEIVKTAKSSENGMIKIPSVITY